MRLLMVSQYSNTIIIILCMLYTGLSNTNNLNRLYIYEHLANLATGMYSMPRFLDKRPVLVSVLHCYYSN